MKKIVLLLVVLPMILIISACQSAKESPLQLIPGLDTVEINTEFVDQGALYQSETEDVVIYSLDSVDVTTLGAYQLVYSYTDLGKTYSTIRYVIVVDQIPPIITLNLGVDTIKVGETWIDQGAIAVDNSLENISVAVSNRVNSQIAGTYEVIYLARDSSGNTTTMIRYVTVI